MNDQYDPEQGSGAPEEHAGEDAWRDDQPPVDDFADEPAHEEAASASHDVEPDMEEEETGEVQMRRKSLFLPIAAGVGGLIILGGVVFWQLSRTGLPVQPSPRPVAALAAADTAPQGSSDLNALYKGTSSVSPNLPIEETAPTTALALPEAASAAPASSTGVAMPTAPKPAPANQEPLTPSMPAIPPVAATPSAPPAAASSETQARLDALNARIEDLSKSLDQETKQLGQLGNMITADHAAPVAAPNPVADAAVEERLAKIEQRLADLQQQQSVAKTVATAPAAPEMASPSMPETPSAAAPAEAPPVAKKLASSHKKTKTVSRHVAAPVEHQASSKTRWFLRAATPDEAWVSTGANSSELRHVEVGDSLPGIGRVKSIRQIDGAWVVEGSSGSVR